MAGDVDGQKYRRFSRFCRDQSCWESLSDVILFPLAKAKASSGGSIRCWSCGCSTGEEAYSLSLVWKHRLAEHFPDIEFSVIGTDLSKDCIDAANEGIYPQHSVAGLPSAWIDEDFEPLFESTRRPSDDAEPFWLKTRKGPAPVGRTYRLKDHARHAVSFEKQDVQDTMPSGPFDLVLSRYAICLYLAPEMQQQTLLTIASQKLAQGGYLIIGAEDHLPQGVAEQTDLHAVAEPVSHPQPLRGMFRKGSCPSLAAPQTLRTFLRARGSDADWVLNRDQAIKKLTRCRMTTTSRAIWARAVLDGRRQDSNVLDRMAADEAERKRRAAERAEASLASQLVSAPGSSPHSADAALRSFAARMDADSRRRREREEKVDVVAQPPQATKKGQRRRRAGTQLPKRSRSYAV